MALAIGASDQVIDTFGATTATTPGVATAAANSSFFVGILTSAGQTITNVTDNKGNTYTIANASQTYNSALLKCVWYKSYNGTGGAAHTVSVTIGGSDFLTVFFQEITGAGAGGEDAPVRASSNDVATPFTVTAGAATAQANEALLCLVGFNTTNISALAESTGFTITQSVLTGASDAAGCIAVDIVSAIATYTPSFTGTGLTDCGLQLMSIKEPGGGGGGGIALHDSEWFPMEQQTNPMTVSVW